MMCVVFVIELLVNAVIILFYGNSRFVKIAAVDQFCKVQWLPPLSQRYETVQASDLSVIQLHT